MRYAPEDGEFGRGLAVVYVEVGDLVAVVFVLSPAGVGECFDVETKFRQLPPDHLLRSDRTRRRRRLVSCAWGLVRWFLSAEQRGCSEGGAA